MPFLANNLDAKMTLNTQKLYGIYTLLLKFEEHGKSLQLRIENKFTNYFRVHVQHKSVLCMLNCTQIIDMLLEADGYYLNFQNS